MPASSVAPSQRVWLITGCSSGLGLLLAKAALTRSDKVIATARDVGSLDVLPASDSLRTLQLDVTASQSVLDKKVEEAIAFFGRIDVLCNNAGYLLSGVLEHVSQEQLSSQFETNVFGPLRLTKALLPHMRRRNGGTILFMSSIAGWVGSAAGGPYSATKFALEGIAESLQKELHGIAQCHLIVLGQFRTNILGSGRKQTAGRDEIIDPAYAKIHETVDRRYAVTDGHQPGDPVLAVELVTDLVRREGRFAGRETVPFRLFLGSDSLKVVRAKCQETIRTLDEYEDVSCSTDFPGGPEVAGYK